MGLTEEKMATNGQQKKLSKSVLAILIIAFSFIAGVTTAAGVNILTKKSGPDWMYELAMSFFLLLCSVGYARQLVRRAADL
jgi:TRAP-type C4-dicarboxylate transport system permease small subunit